MGKIREFLVSMDYGNDYIALWVTSSIFFLAIALGPALVYLIFYGEIDKSVKIAMRGHRHKDIDPEDPEYEAKHRRKGRRRRKRFLSRRVLMVHAPAVTGLLLLGTLTAFGLTRLLSTT